MATRMELHEELKAILGTGFVYFQAPESMKMTYPCIVYSLSDIHTSYADNKPYENTKRYMVTVIDKDPDSQIPDRMMILPLCSFDRFYTADNLNHWVFNLYY